MAKCCVRGCSNKLEVGSSIRMFRFPALLEKPKSLVELSRQRRYAWLKALNRENLPEDVLKSIGICSEHFVTGSPARLKDNEEVDWVPTIKMGTPQRNRVEKKITSPSQQMVKVKRVPSVEKLSELEKLKNELKCKDELIKSYKDESLQLKNQQRKIVTNYEERLKEKDNKIRMSIRELQKETKEPQGSENQEKTSGISMRSGRILHKQTKKHKLIKPCTVRVRRFLQVKKEQEDEEELTLANFSSKTYLSSKQNTSREISLRGRTPKDPTSNEPSPKTRSLRETASRNPTPVNFRLSKQLSISPKQTVDNLVEDLDLKTSTSKRQATYESNKPRPASKQQSIIESNKPKPASKQFTDSSKPKPASKPSTDSINKPKPASKKTNQSEVEVVQEKLEGPSRAIKRRVEESRTPSQNSAKSTELRTPRTIIEKVDESASVMASTRTRRAPKPNPKYANDDVITPNINKLLKRDKTIVLNEAGLDSDSGDDFFYGGVNDTETEETNDEKSDAFEINDSSDFSDGDFLLKRRRTTTAVQKPSPAQIVSRSNTPVAKRSRTERPLPVQVVPQAIKTPSASTAVESRRLLQGTPKVPTVQSQILANRKRKLDETQQSSARKEPPESIIVRNKRLNIALYDANDARPASPVRSAANKQNIAMSQTKVSSVQTTASTILQPKRQMPGPLSSKTGSLLLAQQPKSTKPKNQPQVQQIKSPPAHTEQPIDIFDSANTQDDFETMPTFTIVNINDIIKKKGDSLLSKRPDEDFVMKTTPPQNHNNNRRKPGPNTLQTDKLLIDPPKQKPMPKSAFTNVVKKTILQSNVSPQQVQTKPQQRTTLPPPSSSEQRNQIVDKYISPEKSSPFENLSPNKDKPAPRILNSVVGKKTFPVQPILSKPDHNLDLTDDSIDKSVMVKENVGANKLVPVNNKPTQVRKLPAEKVCVQRQGNKLIKKITCFETWYVINIPETQELIVKNILDIPLITLGNAAKTIRLPSSSWSSKVTLYKLSPQMATKANITPYTGDLSDQSIKEEDRDKYQPSCVMFRRMTQEKSKTRMPYDRAVIFKMKTFFTNIDGKNVRLVGAPSKITSFRDIEVLLELVDELDLLHEFVETASTV